MGAHSGTNRSRSDAGTVCGENEIEAATDSAGTRRPNISLQVSHGSTRSFACSASRSTRQFCRRSTESSLPALVHRLVDVGLQREFILQRLLPKPPGSLPDDIGDTKTRPVAVEAAEAIERIYGWPPAILFGRAADYGRDRVCEGAI